MKNPFPYVTAPVGTPILLEPYRFRDAQMAVFFLEASSAALNSLLDTYINEPSGGTYEYRSLGVDGKAFIVMIMARMTVDVRNTDGQYYGQEPYNELSFWIPCHDRRALLRGKFSPALFLPFLFPDALPPVATGREVYGFAKQIATYTFPKGTFDMRDPAFTAEMPAFKKVGPGNVATPQTFISVPSKNSAPDVNTIPGTTPEATEAPWDSISKARDAITRQFLGSAWTCSATGESIDDVVNWFLAEWPAIFLKQFPSVQDARVAESRSITTAPFHLEKFFGGFPYMNWWRLEPHTFDITFPRLASMPIVKQLGLTTSNTTPDADIVFAKGCWVHVDFSLEPGKTKQNIKPPKQKIAVLGGGIGALSAIYGIVQDPDWQDKYDITLYQMGWRLGGKGASGRNREKADRIEEHGLHIWFGYYENAFRLIQACYAELGRPLNAPLATWDMAFKPHNTIVVEEFVPLQKWIPWVLTFAPNDQVPGQGHAINDHPIRLLGELHAIVTHTTDKLGNLGRSIGKAAVRAVKPTHAAKTVPSSSIFERAFYSVAKTVDSVVEEVVEEIVEEPIEQRVQTMLTHCNTLLADLPSRESDFDALITNIAEPLIKRWLDIVNELRELVTQLLEPFIEVFDSIRRIILLIDLALAVAKGILVDGVLLRGYNAINDQNFTDWLIKNGASKTTANSAIVRSFYDLYLAFPNGENQIVGDGVAIGGNVSAGELLHSYVLVALCYRGAIMWKMQAGMGDTVMTPIYQVLAQKGVKFEFFHKVTDLRLAKDDGQELRIGEIDVDVQATVKPNVGRYNPLYDVKGLPCWPATPLYEQLVQGRELREQHIDLESSWSPWKPVAKKTLKLGEDFDHVVLGISVAALPYITSELSAASSKWKTMLEKATTSQTQAMQLWLNINLEEAGWPSASPVLDAYAEPFNTWAVMDQTLDKETWPQSALPFSIAYFCNNKKDAHPIPPFSDHGYPERARAEVRASAKTWLEQYTGNLWPFATTKNGKSLDWSNLVDLHDGTGVERFDAQYFRANVDPTERYVCNAANTNQYRLKSGESGFVNLFLAGDWTDNGSLNLGNVESTVISGLQAARALTGYPFEIVRG